MLKKKMMMMNFYDALELVVGVVAIGDAHGANCFVNVHSC